MVHLKFDCSFTDPAGELWQAIRVNNVDIFTGWLIYKNGNFKQHVPAKSFSIDGKTDVVANNDIEAIEFGILIDALANEAERIFNKNHPELNP